MIKEKINKFFKYETMDGGGTCPIYLERWELLSLFGYEVYLHHFLDDDWSRDYHNHPRRFISIGLKGRYVEEVCTYDKGVENIEARVYQAPWIRTFPATHIHRIRMGKGEKAWTLVIVLRKSQPWGFFQKGVFIPWYEYVFGGKSRKSC